MNSPLNKVLLPRMALISIFAFFFARTDAQANSHWSSTQIDSLIKKGASSKRQIDTFQSFEEYFKTYKKILGVKIRTSKGVLYEETVVCDKKLIYHGENWIVGYGSRRRTYHDYRNIYFINNAPAKYERFIRQPGKKEKEGILKRKFVLYIDQGQIVKSDSSIDDNEMDEKKLNAILDYLNKEQQKLIPYTGYTLHKK